MKFHVLEFVVDKNLTKPFGSDEGITMYMAVPDFIEIYSVDQEEDDDYATVLIKADRKSGDFIETYSNVSKMVGISYVRSINLRDLNDWVANHGTNHPWIVVSGDKESLESLMEKEQKTSVPDELVLSGLQGFSGNIPSSFEVVEGVNVSAVDIDLEQQDIFISLHSNRKESLIPYGNLAKDDYGPYLLYEDKYVEIISLQYLVSFQEMHGSHPYISIKESLTDFLYSIPFRGKQ